jgi:hypothetical protein
VDLDAIYQVIRVAAVTRGLISYSHLSVGYVTLTGSAPPSERTAWDDPLTEINRRLFGADPKAPAISALVVDDSTHRPEPGHSFWGSTPNTPARPRASSDIVWAQIVETIHNYEWPPTLPGSAPGLRSGVVG